MEESGPEEEDAAAAAAIEGTEHERVAADDAFCVDDADVDLRRRASRNMRSEGVVRKLGLK